MGLDSVEMVMRFEDRFGIEIPDADAERLLTTRDVYEYVHARVADQSWKPSPTHHAFHRLRRVAPPLPERLRPDTPLELLCPLPRRRGRWPALGKAAGMSWWPKLRRPAWTVWVGMALVLAVAIAAGIAARGVTVGLLAGVASWWLIVLMTRPLAKQFAPGTATVGDLLQDVASNCLAPAGGWTKERVREAVRVIVMEQIGLKPDHDDDAHFVRDLGLN